MIAVNIIIQTEYDMLIIRLKLSLQRHTPGDDHRILKSERNSKKNKGTGCDLPEIG